MDRVEDDDDDVRTDIVTIRAASGVKKAFNRGRVYDCGRVPPLPKKTKKKTKQQHDQSSSTIASTSTSAASISTSTSSSPFTLLSFLKGSHTNRRKDAFSESGWFRRIRRGQISVDGRIVRDPGTILSKAKQNIKYHRLPWKEPILRVVVGLQQGVAAATAGKEEEIEEAVDGSDEASTLTILYIDDHILVVHKPSGLPTMPSQTYFEYSVLNALRRLYNGETNNPINNNGNNNKNNSNKNNNIPQNTTTNVVATTRARQLIRSHCSAEPQPVHRLGVGTSGVLVVATSLLGRQKLTDAIRWKSHNNSIGNTINSFGNAINSNINNNNNSQKSGTMIRKVYRALVYARRCDDRPGKIRSSTKNNNKNCHYCSKRSNNNNNGPLIPDCFTIDCPIGSVPFPIGGGSIHAACPLEESESDFLYSHVHTNNGPALKNDNVSADDIIQPTVSPSPRDDNHSSSDPKTIVKAKKKKKNTTKPALSHARVLCRKTFESVRNNHTGSSALPEEMALVEVEIPTGRPHQIRIHMAYAGYPLVGDPLYLPGGIPNTLPLNFKAMKKEEEDMETDDENKTDRSDDNDDMGVIPYNKTTADNRTTKTTYIKRVALPRDCGYHLHAHTITLEHPCCSSGQQPPFASGDVVDYSNAKAKANDNTDRGTVDPGVVVLPPAATTTMMAFTAPPPPILREEKPRGAS